ncbi:Hypothetical protein CINCED_3A011925 [Cinara cedri]|uniref:Uncharacterized protein n=1 Tax=Cinara cedri TaxID=506608 RepID=A0A5E4N7H2_9HEMI|nr:Hypothetical protein CINCED_3A011925 [Cinara cedri]
MIEAEKQKITDDANENNGHCKRKTAVGWTYAEKPRPIYYTGSTLQQNPIGKQSLGTPKMRWRTLA